MDAAPSPTLKDKNLSPPGQIPEYAHRPCTCPFGSVSPFVPNSYSLFKSVKLNFGLSSLIKKKIEVGFY